MKKFILLLLISSSLNAFTQVSKTVNITAGNLSTVLTTNEKSTVTNLTIAGTIDARDFKTMRDDMPVLAFLDISGVKVNAYSGQEGTAGSTSIFYPPNEIPVRAFCTTASVGKISLNTIKLPSSITSIGNWSLLNCTGLSSVEIPKSVLSVERSAFNGCTNMSSLVFESPSSLTYIDSMAFRNCDKLKTVTIPSTVSIIDYCAFYDCNELSSISFDSNSSLTIIEIYAFGRCPKLTNFSILPKVTTIGNFAFLGSNALISVDANNPNYSSIDGVLYNKEQTQLIYCPISKSGSFNIPSSVTTIGEDAFYSCANLNSIVIPSSLKTIGIWAFENCTGLTTISLPSSVNSIGKSAFYNCTGLTSIYCFAQKPIDLSSSDKVFDGVNKNTCKLYVPKGSKSNYQYAYQWTEFNNIIEISGFTFSSNSVKIEAVQGSKATIDINSYVTWKASSDQSWLTVSPASGSENGKLTLTATANLTNTIRSAKVTVSATGVEPRTILVVQSYILQSAITKLYDFDCQNPYNILYLSQLVTDGIYIYGMMNEFNESKCILFRIKPDGSDFKVMNFFDFQPVHCYLTLDNNVIYGSVFLQKSSSTEGFIFKINTDGSKYLKLNIPSEINKHLSRQNLFVTNNTIFGSTSYIGMMNPGYLFKVNSDGTGFSKIYTFKSHFETRNLILVDNSLLISNNGELVKVNLDGSGYFEYGITTVGDFIVNESIVYGIANQETGWNLFKINYDGSGYKKLYANADSDTEPESLKIVGESLYGLSWNNDIIKINLDGTGFKLIPSDFPEGLRGTYPTYYGLTQIGDKLFGLVDEKKLFVSSLYQINTIDDTCNKILKFGKSFSGMFPSGTLQESGNYLYGSTFGGGTSDVGTIFRINKDGSNYIKLHEFDGKEGAFPNGQLTLIGETLFGTTTWGFGDNNNGNIYKINIDGTGFKKLYDFDGTNGYTPNGSLVFYKGKFYGNTSDGGANDHGVIFSINTDGSGFSKILDYISDETGERSENSIIISNDVIYGVSTVDYGSVFRVNTDGTGLKKIFKMNDVSGDFSYCKPLLINDELYITTSEGGENGVGTIFKIKTDGTGFTVLYNFDGIDNDPDSWGFRNNSLMFHNGKIYGTATDNGINEHGYLYSINLDGTGFTKISDFNGEYGSMPYLCDLIIDDNEDIYGMTTFGGKYSGGIIYKYSLGEPSTFVRNFDENTSIKVFPNPTSGNLKISFNTVPESETWITVYDISGQAILKTQVFNKEQIINLKGNQPGLYLIKVTQGTSNTTFKIVLNSNL
jgi:uncharacterized repeat protein (TIGR03803 family)